MSRHLFGTALSRLNRRATRPYARGAFRLKAKLHGISGRAGIPRSSRSNPMTERDRSTPHPVQSKVAEEVADQPAALGSGLGGRIRGGRRRTNLDRLGLDEGRVIPGEGSAEILHVQHGLRLASGDRIAVG